MSILERFKRMAKANIHDALDRMESPEKNLKQRIRELEEAVKEAKVSAASFAASLKKSEKEQDQLKRLKAEWENKAAQAMKLNDEPAARKALEAKLKLNERLVEIEPQVARSSETYRQLRNNIEKLGQQLADSKLKMTELLSRQQAASAQKNFSEHLDKASALSSENEEFQKMEEQVFRKEAEAEIEQEARGDLRGIEDQVSRQSQQLQVDAELAALKKKVAKTGL